MAKNIAQIIVLGAQIVGRAFVKSLQQEIAASKHAANTVSSGPIGTKSSTKIHKGLTLEEAKEILNVQKLEPDNIKRKFDHLFKMNDQAKGGSFYLQSKIVRAKERIDEEFKRPPKEDLRVPRGHTATY